MFLNKKEMKKKNHFERDPSVSNLKYVCKKNRKYDLSEKIIRLG